MAMFKAVLLALSLNLGSAITTDSGFTCIDECADSDGGGKWCNTGPTCDYSWDYCGSGDHERSGTGMAAVADDLAAAPAASAVDTSGVTVPDCPSCGYSEQLTKDEIATALTLHNQMRGAVGTPPLKWNCKLQCQIQKHASKGVYEHSDSFNAPIPAGENLASGSDGVYAAWMWFSEYGAAHGGQATFNCCGHYTAMVWKATKEIGCGKSTSGDGIYLCQYTNAQPNFGGASDFAANVPIFGGTAADYNKGGLSVATGKKMFAEFTRWGFADMPALYDSDIDMPRHGLPIVAVPLAAAGFLSVMAFVGLVVRRFNYRRAMRLSEEELIEDGQAFE